MKKLSKSLFILGLVLLIVCSYGLAQNKALELSVNGVTSSGNGPSTLSQTATFEFDNSNYTATTVPNFETNTPAVTVTVGLQSQTYFNLPYGSCTTGLSFGTQKSEWDDGTITTQAPTPGPLYALIGANVGTRGPDENVFKTKPSALINTIDPTGNQFGAEGNWGFPIFTTVEPLQDNGLAKDGRYLYGELVITFSRPVLNPVLHLASLGGSSWYLPSGAQDLPANWKMSYFTTELEMVTTGFTSTRLAGTPFFDVPVGTNNILNNATRPNGDSQAGLFDKKGNSAYGAATGSVQVNGVVTQLVYKVYLRGATGNTSDFNFSFDRNVTTGTPGRDPFYGDYWAISFSLDKPTQQISGNVFNDRDGLTDNNINQSVGVANPKTNVGGVLYANLLNAAGTTVVATVPIGADGAYLFDNVPVGTYSVQLTTNQGVVGQPTPATALPTGWINTGENGSNAPGNGTGSDGTVNGRSASITVNTNDIKPEVNFGIERIPESVDFLRIIPSPSLGTVMTLSPNAPYPLPPLTGSDPEDQATSGTLAGKNVRITTVPNNATLRYNGVVINNGDLITSFNPDLFTITFIGPAQANSQFNYAYVDAAGVQDPTPAVYRLVWSGGPLAITLNNFTAVKNNCTADLTWSTASEINASRFEVEITTNNNAVYNKVGSVNATASNGSGKTYQFSYPMQPNTQYYFRLKMIDKDGSFKYSDVRPLMSCEGKGVITIAPNPVIDRFSIAGMENGKNTIVIYAANGQQVKTQIIPQAQGYVYIQNLAAGMYSVKVISEKGNVTVGKIIKK